MGFLTEIGWCDHTFNGWVGCAKISRGCRFCLHPATRVLYADMTWRPIGDVKVGDVLVGFTENPAVGENRRIEKTVVEAVWRTVAPTVELTIGGRTVVASENHKWLAAVRPYWRKTVDLRLHTELRIIGDPDSAPDTASDDYRAGYISGVTAGDGTMRWDPTWRSDKLGFPQSYWRVAINADDRSVLDRLAAYLAWFGVEVNVRDFNGGDRAKPMLKVETRKSANLSLISGLIAERSAPEWKAGWLAGLVDTDGSYQESTLRISQRKDNGVLAAVERYAADLGFAFKIEQYGDSCPAARFMGDMDTKIRFLTRIQPALERKCGGFLGRVMQAPTARVEGVRRGPVRELVDIQTSTRTFIAEGIATHNCYAERQENRWHPARDGRRGADVWGRTADRRRTAASTWEGPRRWNRAAQKAGRPARVFSASLADVFERHEMLDPWRNDLFHLIEETPWLRWMLLTKRIDEVAGMTAAAWGTDWPANAWLGTSVEGQPEADARIPILLGTEGPAERFISAEPLIEHTEVAEQVKAGKHPLSLLIVGGESTKKARPMHPDWAHQLLDDAIDLEVPTFFKQWGEYTPFEPSGAPDPTLWLNPATAKTARAGSGLLDHGDWQGMWGVGKDKAGRQIGGRTWDGVVASWAEEMEFAA